jgi:hypothetical protein
VKDGVVARSGLRGKEHVVIVVVVEPRRVRGFAFAPCLDGTIC